MFYLALHECISMYYWHVKTTKLDITILPIRLFDNKQLCCIACALIL